MNGPIMHQIMVVVSESKTCWTNLNPVIWSTPEEAGRKILPSPPTLNATFLDILKKYFIFNYNLKDSAGGSYYHDLVVN